MNSYVFVVLPVTLLPQFDHASWCIAIWMRVEVETAICIINGDVAVRQVEYNGWLRIPCGYADTLHTLSHYGALGLIQ